MSGYNKHTGLFQLTQTKACYWLRRSDIPEDCNQFSGLQLACCILVHSDIEVVEYHGSWASIKAGPAEIWEALSGQSSDPERDSLTGDRCPL